MSYRYPRYFHEISSEEVDQLIALNINSTTWMTKLYVEDMAQRGRGCIVNLSSIAGICTQPLLAEYGAAKSYVEKFSKSIHAEYAQRGVSCQCHIPAFVSTKMSKMRTSFTVPDPTNYVEMSCRFIGQSDVIVQPFWLHAIICQLIFGLLPETLMISYFMTTGKKFRKRGLEKDDMLKQGIKVQKTSSKRSDPLLESFMFWRKDLKTQ